MIRRLLIETLGFDENLVKTVNPVPSTSMYSSQIKIKPKLKSNNILFIASGQKRRIKERIDSKGLALTIETFKKAKAKDLNLLIDNKKLTLWRRHQSSSMNINNNLKGYFDVKSVFKENSIYGVETFLKYIKDAFPHSNLVIKYC